MYAISARAFSVATFSNSHVRGSNSNIVQMDIMVVLVVVPAEVIQEALAFALDAQGLGKMHNLLSFAEG